MDVTLLLCVAALASPGAAAGRQATEPFPDVPKDHWAYAAVMDLKAKGILIGYPPEPARRPTASPSRQSPSRHAPRSARRSGQRACGE